MIFFQQFGKRLRDIEGVWGSHAPSAPTGNGEILTKRCPVDAG